MTPAQRCRLAMAMVALAAYPAACAEQPAEEAGPIVHETPRLNGRHTQDTPESFIVDLPRATTTRVNRSRPRPAPPVAAPTPGGGGDIWAALARCESGGNPRAVSASGTYRGAFQFSLATWRSVGMSGDPIDHSYGEQLAAAQRLQARSGWGQWPACSRKLGLR